MSVNHLHKPYSTFGLSSALQKKFFTYRLLSALIAGYKNEDANLQASN